jgi:hypothetical protein
MKLLRLYVVAALALGAMIVVPCHAQDASPSDVMGASVVPESDDARIVAPPASVSVPTATDSNQSNHSSGSGDSDQNSIRTARKNGTVLPYGKLLKKIKQTISGDVIRVRVLRRDPSFLGYEFTVLDKDGHYTRIALNARTGVIISKKRR